MSRYARPTRRGWIVLTTSIIVSASGMSQAHAEPATIQVFKSPYCGCCKAWAEHLRAEGFAVAEQGAASLGVLTPGTAPATTTETRIEDSTTRRIRARMIANGGQSRDNAPGRIAYRATLAFS